MCTLEPLGYTSSQFFTIPYLVLNKAMKNNIDKPTESNTQILELVSETCARMIATNSTFRQQTVESLEKFVGSPENRTADVVADLPTLSAQLWAWH